MKKRWITTMAAALALSTLFSTAAFAEGWSKTGTKWFYWLPDGTVARNTWITEESGLSYWLNDNGEMATAQWVFNDPGWYYVNGSGEMLKSQLLDLNGRHYWLGDDGRMLTEEWKQTEDGKWYYFLADGSAVKNKWYTIDGEEYYFLKSGVMAADALVPGGGRVDASGRRIK